MVLPNSIRFLILSVAVTAFACSSSNNADSGAANMDAHDVDSGSSGSPDATHPADTGSQADTGGQTDAGGQALDSSTTDANAGVDAGQSDSGMMMNPCDPVSETGCPGGDSCFLVPVSQTMISTECLPTPAAPVADGQMCMTMTENCTQGASCFQIAGDMTPVCHRLCHLGMNADCMVGGSTVAASCLGLQGATYGICVRSCSPVMDTCPSGQACALVGNGGTVCAPQGAAPGASCSANGTCTKGYVCAGPTQMAATCEQACDAMHTCPMGKTCSAPFMGYTFGACM